MSEQLKKLELDMMKAFLECRRLNTHRSFLEYQKATETFARVFVAEAEADEQAKTAAANAETPAETQPDLRKAAIDDLILAPLAETPAETQPDLRRGGD